MEGVIEDVRLSLAAARTSLDPAQFELVGARVASVSRQASRVVSNMTQPVAEKPQRVPQLGAPLTAQMFERRRPWLWSSLAIAALAAVLAPICFHHGGWLLFGEFVAAMVLATFVLALGPGVAQRGLRHLPGQAARAFARYSVAGCSGALLFAALRWGRWDSFTISVSLVLPYAIAFSATVVSGAVGLVAANRRAVSSLDAIEAERAELEATAWDQESSIRYELAELLHGPVLGRLSACAMALNFHAAELGYCTARTHGAGDECGAEAFGRGGDGPQHPDSLTAAVAHSRNEHSSMGLVAVADGQHDDRDTTSTSCVAAFR